LVELVDKVETVVSTEVTVDVGVWDNGVDNITTENDLAEDGEEIDLSVQDSLVDFVADQVLTEELLEEEDILLGDSNGLVNNDKTADNEVDEVSGESLAEENLTENGEEVNLLEEDSFENILGDDLVADELLEEDGLTFGQDNGVNDWDNGVNDITANDHLAEDGEDIELSDEEGLVDLWSDELLTEEFLDEEDILLGGDWDNGVDGNKTVDNVLDEVGGDSLAFKNLTEDGDKVDFSNDNSLVDLLVDDLLTEEILEDDEVLFGQDNGVNDWDNGVDNITADENLTEDGEEIDLSEEEGLVDFWSDELLAEELLDEEDLLLSGDWDNGVNDNETVEDQLDEVGGESLAFKNLTEDGDKVDFSQDNLLVDIFGDDLVMEEILEDDKVLFSQDNVGFGVEWNNGVDDWDNLLVNLNIDDLGFIDESLFLSWVNLNISLDFSEISGNDWLVDVQVLVELVQKELVVGGFSGEWKSGWESETVVGVWENILVLQKDVIDQSLESKDILFVSVGRSGDGVLSVEKLDNGVDVLVEENGVEKVLLVGWDGPELLEVDGLDKTLERWVLNVLAEQGNLKIFLEQLGRVQLLDGEDLLALNSGVVVDSSNSLVDGENGGVKEVLLTYKVLLLVDEFLLQQ